MISDALLIRVDTSKLYQPFLLVLKLLLDEAASAGNQYWGISGYRSYIDQAKLYDQGRTTPGAIVTNGKPGFSSHQFGLACDICADGDIERTGLQPDYKPESYAAIGPLALKHGLVWGGNWSTKDLSHLQWPGYVTGSDLAPLRKCYESSGMPAVFEYVSKGAPK